MWSGVVSRCGVVLLHVLDRRNGHVVLLALPSGSDAAASESARHCHQRRRTFSSHAVITITAVLRRV